jgi:hypothetical protein
VGKQERRIFLKNNPQARGRSSTGRQSACKSKAQGLVGKERGGEGKGRARDQAETR